MQSQSAGSDGEEGVAFAFALDAHRMPDVVTITQGNPIQQAIDEALDHIALQPLIGGRRVAVKPNDTWASKDDRTGITQPDTLRVPALSLSDAIGRFTEAAYGHRLDFEHA